MSSSYWNDLLPMQLAEWQIAWERHTAVKRALDVGVRAREIAVFLGVSVQDVHNHKYLIARNSGIGPAERYLTKDGSIAELAQLIIKLKKEKP